MTVGEVNRLLEGVARGLADLSKKSSDGLLALYAAMQPFAEQTIEQFVTFLSQCEEYKRTGIVEAGKKKAAPRAKKDALTVLDAAGRVRELLDEVNGGTVTSSRIDSILVEFKTGLTKPQWDELLTALNVSGKARTKDQAVEKLKQVLNSQVEMYVKAQAFDQNR
jgi:hypothetical protein